MMLFAFASIVNAENKFIEDIPIEISWHVARNASGSIEGVNITVKSSDDDNHVFSKNITNSSSDSSQTLKIDIVRNVECTEADISNLTRALLEKDRNVISYLNESYGIVRDFADCKEGKGRIAENNVQFQFDRDKYKNESDYYKYLYDIKSNETNKKENELNSCSNNLLTANTENNNCQNNLTQSKKKPGQYAIISIIVTLIAVYLYNRNKEGTPPEMRQFSQK